ncbi:uncharacterized protein LOC100679393 [Nasonia vitripennis]|uniref:Uncharacterized protein n=1 Tax=Nasonia vitripennis TaxID=7425 RepID=A0A7M7PXH5_NASVI|nr:uncharacterized protein LOC100679393 [Nasonia vitripennis]
MMTTLLRGSIHSVLRLERLQLDPEKRLVKNDVQICLRKHEFTIHPVTTGGKLQRTAERRKKKLSIVTLALLALAVTLCSYIAKLTFPYPSHASCLVKWQFGEPCVFVAQRLRSQIIEWSNYKYCGFKCLYKMREAFAYENNTIQAIREFPQRSSVDEIDIVFADSTHHSCTALAKSRSKDWYSLFDDGRNYCNLRDLITGAGYDEDRDFLEFTSNTICTQYDMAYCD